MSLEEKLARIKSPNLQSQLHTVVVLSSIEETLHDQKAKFTPTAYFAALLALLRQTTGNGQEEGIEIIRSAVYLLDLVTSHVPAAILRTQFTTIVTLLIPFADTTNADAPLVRSAIGCLESIFLAQDQAAWNQSQAQISPRSTITALLSLAIDNRPKVRRRAQEAVTIVLKSPPPGPALDHPAADLCATAAQNNLKNAIETVLQLRKQKGRPDDSHDPAIIHALQLVKTIATASSGWPSKNIEQLCELLLSISRSRNEYLVTSAFEVFEVIFEGMQDEVHSAKLPRLLDAVVELKPAQNDSQLLPPWIAVLSRGYGAMAEAEPEDVFAKMPELFDLVAQFLTSPLYNIRVSASECLISFFANCIPDSVVLDPSIYDEKVLQQLANKAQALLGVKFQTAWMEVFTVLRALFDALRWRGDPFLVPIVKAVGELRGKDSFQGKKEADEVIGHAIRNLGPQVVLSVLPHNLIKPRQGHPGRAWLLPLLRDHISNTNLQHFKAELIPLSEAMYQRVLDHGSSEKTMDVKVFETVVQQVWATVPGYCDLPLDLVEAVDQSFAELISNILYRQIDLRVDVCRGLQNLVESNQAVLASDITEDVLLVERRMKRSDAEKNLAHLAGIASNLLAVLFNVYSQTLPQSRAYILACINAYLSITQEKDLVDTFERVGKMLEASLPSPNKPPPKKEPLQPAKDKMPPTSHTLLDLIIALSIYLPRSTFGALFTLASNILTNPSIHSSDSQLIKKAYKLIPRLATSDTGVEALKARNGDLQQLFLATANTTPVPARRDRLLAINTLFTFLPLSDLHFIPAVLSEIVLACKDTNEKARTAGFETLLAAANKIVSSSGSKSIKIRNRLVSHMPDDAPDAKADLEEIFTMVSAGLAGVAPHMVAASVTALSRLLFEYHDSEQLSQKMKEELVDTVTMFLQSNNREIVRAVLGFVKVIVVVLPLEMLDSRMETIVPGLMTWSKENKGRLRVKVKGILERLMRRFGAAKVEAWVGDDDRKMVVNIRKRRERAKRKKTAAADDSVEEDGQRTEKFDEAFDEAIYGSDDENASSDSDGNASDDRDDDAMSGVSFKTKQTNKSGKSTKHAGPKQYIRVAEDDDEPLDLLDPRSMASITSNRRPLPSNKNDPTTKRKKAKFNEDGKLIFDNDDPMTRPGRKGRHTTAAAAAEEENEAAQGDAINAYLDAVDGPDAVRRGQKGRLKMKSGMQKSARRGRDEDNNDNDQMDLDVDEAREVARRIMAGGGGGGSSPMSPKGKGLQSQRRGLGVEKGKGSGSGSGSGGGGGNNRGGKKFGGGGSRGGRGGGGSGHNGRVMKKGVRFSRHPRR